jgi:peptidoglycan/xylan/chitin deacetylase (PgdA/CDA1 family)
MLSSAFAITLVPTRALKTLAQNALHSLGVVDAIRYSNRRACRILMYHRFPDDQAHFKQQCEHIRRHYHPVSMRQVADSLHGGPPLPDNALAITVDDGFRDFLDNAHPVLVAFDIPATVFLVSDFLDKKLWLWLNQLDYMLNHTAQPIDKGALRQSLKTMPNKARLQRLAELKAELGVEVPSDPPAEYAPLTWDEVRSLASKNVEFGPHTRTHPILSSLTEEAELRDEIAGSKARVDAELGFPSQHFCYPNGTRADFTPQVIAIVKECGFTTAVTTEGGLVSTGADPLQLVRLGVEPKLPERYFAEMLAGMRTH